MEEDLLQEQVRAGNQLRDLLHRYYPNAEPVPWRG